MSPNIVAVIPAHLASVRFPRKVLYPISGLPMIEHVRRRALLSGVFNKVIVATCDREIAETLSIYGANVMMTADTHKNGTSRVAEAVEKIDCTHIVLLQADEPLLLPGHLVSMVEAIRYRPNGDAWNVTGPISQMDELDRHSFVKCIVGTDDRILYCFRRTPSFQPIDIQRDYVRKILGIIAYKREVLTDIASTSSTKVEKMESIEQLRILDRGFFLRSVSVDISLASVNEPHEMDEAIAIASNDPEQKEWLQKVVAFSS